MNVKKKNIYLQPMREQDTGQRDIYDAFFASDTMIFNE